MTNPFERDDIRHLVLVNHEVQYSLWPTIADVPEGWSVVFEGTRQECLDYVEANWTETRPRSLVLSMEGRT
ncbi:protein mbtH [Acrocarpospora corrugata]|uniref:Protein mbtH n=1 Tax=Acrocarpospora corrugata TaxID=35763 RepID=A0A5M3WAA6_9ACTN|nr:MbtH family protein [Acrocarpospora corrugata]GES05746.1 protein mbtH [Acrocarpospora corrugata]